jgi:hypothetical protein
LLEHAPRRYSFPRYGNFYSNFSTLRKMFFYSMKNVGRVTARTRRGRYYYQGPAPNKWTRGKREQCLAPYGAQGAPSGEG